MPNDVAPADTAMMPAPPTLSPAASAPDRRISIDQLAALGPMADNDRRITWVNSLVDADVQRQSYATDIALARQFAICGQFDELKNASAEQAIATAMVKIQLGRAWGFNAADSMRYIYFTNGKPAVENEIVAAKLQAAGYEWDVEWLEETVTYVMGADGKATNDPKGKPWLKCTGCRLWLKKWDGSAYKPMLDRDGKPISVAFTEADADHALIWENRAQKPLSQKWNFQSWGRDMYYWRAISRVKKYHAPHVLRGGVSREEAAESIPADMMPPDRMPRELAAPAPVVEAPTELHRPTLRDRIIAEGASSFPSGSPVPSETEQLPLEAQPPSGPMETTTGKKPK